MVHKSSNHLQTYTFICFIQLFPSEIYVLILSMISPLFRHVFFTMLKNVKRVLWFLVVVIHLHNLAFFVALTYLLGYSFLVCSILGQLVSSCSFLANLEYAPRCEVVLHFLQQYFFSACPIFLTFEGPLYFMIQQLSEALLPSIIHKCLCGMSFVAVGFASTMFTQLQFKFLSPHIHSFIIQPLRTKTNETLMKIYTFLVKVQTFKNHK